MTALYICLALILLASVLVLFALARSGQLSRAEGIEETYEDDTVQRGKYGELL